MHVCNDQRPLLLQIPSRSGKEPCWIHDFPFTGAMLSFQACRCVTSVLQCICTSWHGRSHLIMASAALRA